MNKCPNCNKEIIIEDFWETSGGLDWTLDGMADMWCPHCDFSPLTFKLVSKLEIEKVELK